MARRLVCGALLTSVLALLLGVGQLQSADSAFAAGTPSCVNSQLAARLSGDTHDNTQRYRFLVLTNTGGRCALTGRPAVSLEYRGEAVGVRGDYFPYSATGGTPRVGAVTVANRGTASVWLAVAVAGDSTCRKQPLDGFLVRLPHQPPRHVGLAGRDRHRYTVCASRTSHELAFSQFLRGAGR